MKPPKIAHCTDCLNERQPNGELVLNQKCIHCAVRGIKAIQALVTRSREERSERCKALLADYVKYGADDAQIRRLVKG